MLTVVCEFTDNDLAGNVTFGPVAAGNRGDNGLLLWRRDIRAAVRAPGAPGAVLHESVAEFATVHERTATVGTKCHYALNGSSV